MIFYLIHYYIFIISRYYIFRHNIHRLTTLAHSVLENIGENQEVFITTFCFTDELLVFNKSIKNNVFSSQHTTRLIM